MLDSWVRYEQQVKESQQTDLARSVIDKVLKNIQDEKTQREILANAVAEVERESLCLFALVMVVSSLVTHPSFCRIGQGEGYLNVTLTDRIT